jgi:hypothetical protein
LVLLSPLSIQEPQKILSILISAFSAACTFFDVLLFNGAALEIVAPEIW